MSKKTKSIIVALSILSAAGIGYFIYSRIRISQLNKKVSSVEEAYTVIDDLGTPEDIPEDDTAEPDVPLYSDTGSDNIDSTTATDTALPDLNSPDFAVMW